MPEEVQKQYELVCIVSPQLEGGDLENTKKEIEEIITKADGSINFKEEKKHNLAYPVNKQRQGIYLITQISIAPEKVGNISKELQLNKQVLRHLITQTPIVKPEAKKARVKKTIKKAEPLVEPKPPSAEPREAKVKLEEIDKKLEEIIGEI
jgi:small subunit ribosomal protein S6